MPRQCIGEENTTDFTFTSHREHAAYWDTEQSAQIDCKYCNTLNVKMTSPDGVHHHVATDFTVEELAPDKFVIFCTVPWLPKAA